MKDLAKLLAVPFLGLVLLGAGCGTAIKVTQPARTPPDEIAATNPRPPHVIDIKYRDTSVNLWNDRLEEGDVSGSSFVWGAFYDAEDEYLILNLNDTYYHYCSVPEGIWNGLQGAESHGKYYNAEIKGQYSCKDVVVPILK